MSLYIAYYRVFMVELHLPIYQNIEQTAVIAKFMTFC